MYLHANYYTMLKENKELISVATYVNDTEKSQQSISRFLRAGRAVPGIDEYYCLGPQTYVLKKSENYKAITAKVRKQKYLFSEKKV